eukprot:TRINITY_DN63893_c0_g1_i4.p1 TRINITY_DN63893_c0_g1~~TRINITY_DN63893_c0_g1_i4.p1  ORF type:complete len:201 (+),score=5.08 TRINITY_DN63893_c0_g1_i4:219-821(+)
MLENVLAAYADHDPQVGYAQGMNFIAALLLISVEEQETKQVPEKAYGMFCHLMEDSRYNLRELFLPELPGHKKLIDELATYINEYLPDLDNHLQATMSGFTHMMYAAEWYSTLFSYRLPLSVVSRIVDAYIVKGSLVLHSVSLALLFRAQKFVLPEREGVEASQGSFESTLRYLKSFPDPEIYAEDPLMRQAMHFYECLA